MLRSIRSGPSLILAAPGQFFGSAHYGARAGAPGVAWKTSKGAAEMILSASKNSFGQMWARIRFSVSMLVRLHAVMMPGQRIRGRECWTRQIIGQRIDVSVASSNGGTFSLPTVAPLTACEIEKTHDLSPDLSTSWRRTLALAVPSACPG